MKSKEVDVKEQLRDVLEKLETPQEIEQFAKNLSYLEFLALIDIIKTSDPKMHKKLSSILVGLPYPAFAEAVHLFSTPQLALLQKECVTEPIQHHLSNFSHEKNHMLQHSASIYELLEQEIQQIDLEVAGRQDIDVLWNKIEDFSVVIDANLNELNKALALAWNTNRLDIIDSLSSSKESMERLKIYEIGHDQASNKRATGLFQKLEDHLNSVYNHNGTLDSDPAIEALSRLSIWYLKDYWELGLLPNIGSEKDLELDPRKHSDQDCANYCSKLFDEAQKSLEAHGLATLKDLKSAYIFSKKTLKEFLDQHKL